MYQANCLNCESSLQGDEKFCPACGQKTAIHRLSLHEIGHDVIHYFTHADKGIFSLLKELCIRPGVVAREYADGRRVKHFKPLNFYLIVMALLVFMTSSFYKEDLSRSRPLEQRAAVAKSEQERNANLVAVKRLKDVNEFIGKYSNVINMLGVPFFTLIFWLFYIRGRFNYTEHLMANIYFIGFIMIFYGLIVVPLLRVISNSMIDLVVISLFFVFEIGYRAFGYYQFMNRRGWMAGLKAVGISILCSAIWAYTSYSLVSSYIRTGFRW